MKRITVALASAALLAAAVTCSLDVRGAAPAGAPPAAGAAAAPGGPGGPGGAGRGGRGGAGGGRGGLGGGARGARGPVVPPGPPQPVPAEVAMVRPTPEEVKQMNDDLSRLMDSDKSPAKALMEKYNVHATLTLPRDNPAIRPAPGVRQGRHDAFVERAKQGGIDLLLDGDSITDFFTGSTEAYTKFFGQYKTANFAVSGDRTEGVLWGLQNGEGTGFQPKAIMLMIGTNNTGGCTGPEIAEGVGAVVYEMRKDFPNAKILLLAIFPRNAVNSAARKTNMEANAIFKKLNDNQHVFYMDIGQVFLEPDGSILPTIMADGLHPTAAGYELWGNAVKDKLAELMK